MDLRESMVPSEPDGYRESFVTAEELQKALDTLAVGPGAIRLDDVRALTVVVVAARTIALPILEADPELVERIASVVYDWRWEDGAWKDDRPAGVIRDEMFVVTRQILAAMSTPTPGAE